MAGVSADGPPFLSLIAPIARSTGAALRRALHAIPIRLGAFSVGRFVVESERLRVAFFHRLMTEHRKLLDQLVTQRGWGDSDNVVTAALAIVDLAMPDLFNRIA